MWVASIEWYRDSECRSNEVVLWWTRLARGGKEEQDGKSFSFFISHFAFCAMYWIDKKCFDFFSSYSLTHFSIRFIKLVLVVVEVEAVEEMDAAAVLQLKRRFQICISNNISITHFDTYMYICVQYTKALSVSLSHSFFLIIFFPFHLDFTILFLHYYIHPMYLPNGNKECIECIVWWLNFCSIVAFYNKIYISMQRLVTLSILMISVRYPEQEIEKEGGKSHYLNLYKNKINSCAFDWAFMYVNDCRKSEWVSEWVS
jgi:hypothetical protein